MNIDYLPKEYREVLIRLLSTRGSFIVQYPELRPNNIHRWFFVPHPASKQSEVVTDVVGKYLVASGWVDSELSDKEYRIQIALGSIDCRIYKIAQTKLMEMESVNVESRR